MKIRKSFDQQTSLVLHITAFLILHEENDIMILSRVSAVKRNWTPNDVVDSTSQVQLFTLKMCIGQSLTEKTHHGWGVWVHRGAGEQQVLRVH